MRHIIVRLCCLVVGLEVAVGLLGLIGAACFLAFGHSSLGPIHLELHAGRAEPSPASRSASPSAAATAFDPSPSAADPKPPAQATGATTLSAGEASILSLREEQGSLLAGTMLDQNIGPAAERNLFVGALRQRATEHARDSSESDRSPAGGQSQPGPAETNPAARSP